MALFSSAWMSQDQETALIAVQAVTSQAELGKIARKARHFDVRMAAIQKLTDRKVLEKVVARLRTKGRDWRAYHKHRAENDMTTELRKAAKQRLQPVCLHDWDGCLCTISGKATDDGDQHDGYCCKCGRCGKIRDQYHQWEGCKCYRCMQVRDEHHEWQHGNSDTRNDYYWCWRCLTEKTEPKHNTQEQG